MSKLRITCILLWIWLAVAVVYVFGRELGADIVGLMFIGGMLLLNHANAR